MGVAFMVVLKKAVDVLQWLGSRRYRATLRHNRRAARASL